MYIAVSFHMTQSEHMAVQRELVDRGPGEQNSPHELNQEFTTRGQR